MTRLSMLLLLALAGRASAQAPAPAGTPPPDSTVHAGRTSGTGSLQRLMAEADSLLKLRGGSHAENAQLYLAWNTPWGMKRAERTRMPGCADSTASDTLYLSFYPGRSARHFTGFTGDLDFLATGQDTLGPWWHMESKGGENGGNIQVDWGPLPDIPGPQPWQAPGHGFAILERTPSAMRLRLLFALTLDNAVRLDSTVTYTLCRVVVRHRRSARLAGCGQPVCVKWTRATFGFELKDEPEVRRGERLVSYGGPWSICEPFHDEPSTRAWKPKPPPSK